MPGPKRKEALDEIGRNGKYAAILADWWFWARPEQRPPKEKWRIWLFLGGRGSGKTRAGAEWIAHGIRKKFMHRVALIGATHRDARSVMIEGPSGLMQAATGATYEPSNSRVVWPDGAIAYVLSAEEPDAIRGFQFDAAWCDEFCKWNDPQSALDMALMAMRLGEDARRRARRFARRCPAPAVRSRCARENGCRGLRRGGPCARRGGRARSVRPFRWSAWLEFGLGVMRLPPAVFWRMSLPEWRACVRGFQARRGVRAAMPLGREALNDLMERYPDG